MHCRLRLRKTVKIAVLLAVFLLIVMPCLKSRLHLRRFAESHLRRFAALNLRRFCSSDIEMTDISDVFINSSDTAITEIIDVFINSNDSAVTEISDVFISVKTGRKYHASRVKLILQTWHPLARNQTHFFTDKADVKLSQATGGRVIKTNCSPGHSLKALCCKTSVEFDAFLSSKKRWMCHFDDDNYVNIPKLVEMLRQYNHTQDWYLGKPSWTHPAIVKDRAHPKESEISFHFATGCGYCFSRTLALKMIPYVSEGRLTDIGERIEQPDDLALGFIVEHLLGKQLTEIKEFRTHTENLRLITNQQLENQISLSYQMLPKDPRGNNIVNVTGFPLKQDPTRLKSIHCHLFPTCEKCQVTCPVKT